MKRTLLLSFFLLLTISVAQAQRKKKVEKTNPQSELPAISVSEAIKKYDFATAEKVLLQEIATFKKNQQETTDHEALLPWLQKAQQKMKSVEQVVFIDSIVVPIDDALNHIHLSLECGALYSSANFFNYKGTVLDRTVFQSQMGDKIFYADPNKKGVLSLYARDVYVDGSYSDPSILNGISDDNENVQNYPFMLTDGATLYFAAQGDDGLGGYDIYMTRYDAEGHRFLEPENIGMPFNSSANDYLYVIDEINNLGWFVTDRNTPLGKVCVYTFIPNETRKTYSVDSTPAKRLQNLARINSIRESWLNEKDAQAALSRLEEARNPQTSYTISAFQFVINDEKIYHNLTDFRSEKARKTMEEWINAKNELIQTRNKLDNLRREYNTATATHRRQVGRNIMLLERNEEKLITQIREWEKNIRKVELSM